MGQNKKRISIVAAFSEPCLILVHRFLFSCYKAIQKSSHNFDIYCYKCNYNRTNRTNRKSDLFQNKIKLPIIDNVSLNVVESAQIEWTNNLPDIAIYDHFAKNFMKKFDYSLFCHDDIVLNDANIFDEMISVLNDSDWENRPYDLLASLSANAIEVLSIRFHPCFIFVPHETFVRRKLSFTYPDHLGDTKKFSWYDNKHDGGAQLLASYYNKQNPNDTVPFTRINKWCIHTKVGLFGIEFSRLMKTEPDLYENKMQKIKQNVEELQALNKLEMKEF